MKQTLVIFLLLFSYSANCQNRVPDSLIYHVLERINSFVKPKKISDNPPLFIRNGILMTLDVAKYENVKFINENEIEPILRKKESKGRSIDICHFSLQEKNDTSYLHCQCDGYSYVNQPFFYRLRFGIKGHIAVSLSCSTNYLPLARFVFLRDKRKWVATHLEELVEERYGKR